MITMGVIMGGGTAIAIMYFCVLIVRACVRSYVLARIFCVCYI